MRQYILKCTLVYQILVLYNIYCIMFNKKSKHVTGHLEYRTYDMQKYRMDDREVKVQKYRV